MFVVNSQIKLKSSWTHVFWHVVRDSCFAMITRFVRDNRRKYDDGKSDDRRHSDGTADGSIQVSSNGTSHNVPPPCQPVQPDSTFNPSVCKRSVHSKRIP